MKIIITGPKASGKTTIGKKVAEHLGLKFIETDAIIEEIYFEQTGERHTFREVYQAIGEKKFRQLEALAARAASNEDWVVISTGGGTMMNPDAKQYLKTDSIIVVLKGDDAILWERINKDGIPDFYVGDDGFEKLQTRNKKIHDAVDHLADIIIDIGKSSNAATEICVRIEELIPLIMRSPSSFGEIVRTHTFGESHGPAIGMVLDGIPPGIEIEEKDIQLELDRRRPGQSNVTTKRNESDKAVILSGIFEGKTTGAPICIIVYNKDQDSSKYDDLKELFRPGHADFAFYKKYGIRDHRGGGRSSGRETAARVMGGSIAKKILTEKGIQIVAYAEEIAGIRGEHVDFSFIEKNPVRSADPINAPKMEKAILDAKRQSDSVGGIVRLIVRNCPAGLGDPVFFKLDARLAMALVSIGAVKGIEFGAGFASARMCGSENNDQVAGGKFASNNAGGILGGISTGEEIVIRVAVKPTPSIAREQTAFGIDGKEHQIFIHGRHDPCIVPRIVPVVEAMTALVLLDAMMIQERLVPNSALP